MVDWVAARFNYSKMKSVIKKAKKYESKKSLDGPMKFLKGNVGKVVKSKKLGK